MNLSMYCPWLHPDPDNLGEEFRIPTPNPQLLAHLKVDS